MWILIVEDELELARALSRGLTAEGYSVEICSDGTTGYEFARRGNFDAIVLDLMLPGMNGYKVLDSLRRNGVRTPVLILTAKSGQYDQIDALDLGADDYLMKPFSFPILLARLRALIRRAAPLEQTSVEVGPLRLDRLKHQAVLADDELELTDLEFLILESLALHPEEPVDKQSIIDHAWNDQSVSANSLEVRIGAVRRKLEAANAALSIETIRGFGYRLVRQRSSKSAAS